MTLFSGISLQAVAEALAAQPEPRTDDVYSTLNGHPRALSVKERAELLGLVGCLIGETPGGAQKSGL